MHVCVCCFLVNLWHSLWLSVLIGSARTVKRIFKTLAQNSSYCNIPAVGGSNPEFNFSHFALLHLWLEWIMIISWLWFGPCLWAWGHSLSELNRRWQWGACATHWVCHFKHFLSDALKTSCTLCCMFVFLLQLLKQVHFFIIWLIICDSTSDLCRLPIKVSTKHEMKGADERWDTRHSLAAITSAGVIVFMIMSECMCEREKHQQSAPQSP